MTISIKDLTKILNIWDTRNGLVLFIILWTSICISIFFKFFYAINDSILNFTILIIFIFVSLFYYYIWSYRRSFEFLTNNINIIFVLYNVNNSPTIEKTIGSFKHRLAEKINQYDFKKRIRLEFKPSDLLIDSKEKAEKLVQNGYVGSTLIIWGRIWEFGNEVKCPNLSFTYFFGYQRYYKNLPDHFNNKIFSRPIQKSVDSLRWNMNLNFFNSFDEYTLNTTEIILFILGRILLTVRRYKDAEEILSKLYISFCGLNWIEQRKRGRLIVETKEQLIRLYDFFHFNYYLENNLTAMEEYSTKSLRLDPYDYFANLSAAICEEEKGNRDTAKDLVNKAENNSKKNQNTHKLSLAYFALDEGDFLKAIEYYNFVIENGVDFEPLITADYLRRKYIETKKIEFIFGEALIKIVWFSGPHDGFKIMKKFLIQAHKEEEKYSLLIKKGENLLKITKI